MIRVIHNEDFLSCSFMSDEALVEYFSKLHSKFLETVAVVSTDNLDDAYRLTNNIECPWIENAGVLSKFDMKYRSTSVGDVMEFNGTLFAVASCGFVEIKRNDNI